MAMLCTLFTDTVWFSGCCAFSSPLVVGKLWRQNIWLEDNLGGGENLR